MKYFYITIAAALSFSAPATAQDAPPPDYSTERLGGEREERRRPPSTLRKVIPAGLLYASFDTSGDYAASREELEAGITRSFARADANANSTLSLVELANWREAILGSRDLLPGNTQFDKNFDNQIELGEFAAVLTDLFDAFDENENGQLEFKEMTLDLRSAGQARGGARERPSGGDRGGRGGGGRGGGEGGQRPQRGN